MKFLLPLTLFGLAIAGSPVRTYVPPPLRLNERKLTYFTNQQIQSRNDDDDKGGPLGIGADDGLLGTKLLNDDGVNVISDGKFLGIGNDDGLLNTGMLSKPDDDD